MDELPFRFVEGRDSKQFVEAACPRFKIPSRWIVNRDIFSIYLEEKTNLKKLFKSNTQRISLTTDTWTSVQRINYMCVTAYLIDDEWKLNKKVISFVLIHSHKGESISKAIESYLLDWGVKNIFTITVDNASSNDIAIGFMKKKVRGSPSRLKKFRELAELLEVEEKSSLCLEVPTRWNSTYMMLRTAIAYKQVFETYESSDTVFTLDLGDSVPSYLDWLSVDSLVIFFKTFYEMTIRISDSLYVTSNSFLTEISNLSCIIADVLQSKSKVEEEMGGKIKEKFSKYWGDPDKMNFITFFGNILDTETRVSYPFKIGYVLVVSISTVASESTFSTSGRVLDNFRSCLFPKMVEAFICTQDWLKGPSQPIVVEENIDDIEKFEKEMINMRIGSSSSVTDHKDSLPVPTVDVDDLELDDVL
ncbi:zinc finger BED domain-containing protein RICESLEEPER 2-like [Cynara cardunculus var. scolymus]|uniref:zinc finger BED domain-containing protein RICESLEEPER 2-like n=1 Tax=Cynara cardunculus var. scolymus TaxID=59895 RepID=UPI000D62963D|nr:zinc finger BED domain-containing protein RICESLEEPER 2-like [Cynara cardunculus var. scolymus]